MTHRMAGTSALSAGPDTALLIGVAAGPASAQTRRLPAKFPLPPHARITGSVHDKHEDDATVALRNGSSAFTFWKTTLPRKGFTAGSEQRAFGAAEIKSSGHGCVTGSQIAVSGKRAAVQCKRSR